MARRRPAMPVRAVRVDDETWRAANDAAVERNEFLHDEIRAFLKRYVKSASADARRSGGTSGKVHIQIPGRVDRSAT